MEFEGQIENDFGRRLNALINHTGLGVRKFANILEVVTGENLYKIMRHPNGNPSLKILDAILIKFPKVNALWLITGRGEMLCESEFTPMSSVEVKEDPVGYNIVQSPDGHTTVTITIDFQPLKKG